MMDGKSLAGRMARSACKAYSMTARIEHTILNSGKEKYEYKV